MENDSKTGAAARSLLPFTNNMYGKTNACRTQVNDMNEDKELTMDFIESLMEPYYLLADVDCNDNLLCELDVIERCLHEKSDNPLSDRCFVLFDDEKCRSIDEIIDKIQSECVKKGFSETETIQFIKDNREEIEDAITYRDDSDVLGELMKNTGNVPVRVEMLSNYDCINSHWLESHGGYIYPGSYFGDMVDALNLNPAKVKRFLSEKGVTVYGRCPDKKSRDGKEQVSYEDFYRELLNSCSGANLLTYIGTISLKELYYSGFSPVTVTIPKGNCCGIFSSMYGGGSVLGMKLRQDVTLELKTENYHGYRLVLENPRSKYDYSIRQVYGVCRSFFGDSIRITSA